MVENLPANARDISDVGSIPGLGRSTGGGHGNPIQYSCLGNPVDRGSWQATVHCVAKSRTWLSDLARILYSTNINWIQVLALWQLSQVTLNKWLHLRALAFSSKSKGRLSLLISRVPSSFKDLWLYLSLFSVKGINKSPTCKYEILFLKPKTRNGHHSSFCSLPSLKKLSLK